jgi:lysophospholipase L1-like esterase
MKNLKIHTLFFLLFQILLFQDLNGQKLPFQGEVNKLTAELDSTGWEKESIVFTGSSSIRMWKNLQEEFPNFPLINTGFGGSQASDLLQHLDTLVLRFHPSAVFIYEGDNDVNAGKTPQVILHDLKQILDRIRMKSPQIPVYFIGAKPSPSRWGLKTEYERFNLELQQLTTNQPNAHYIDVWNPMLDQDGQPRPELFLTDLLHMKPAGYEIWKKQIQKPLISLQKSN